MNNPVFYYNIYGFSTERHIQSKWIIFSCDHRSILGKYILETRLNFCMQKQRTRLFTRDLQWPFRATKGRLFHLFRKVHMRLDNCLLLIGTLYLIPFARYSAFKISVSDLDPLMSPKVKYFYMVRKPMHDFTVVFCWNELSILNNLQDIPHRRFRFVTLTYQGHQKSNISTFLE